MSFSFIVIQRNVVTKNLEDIKWMHSRSFASLWMTKKKKLSETPYYSVVKKTPAWMTKGKARLDYKRRKA